VVVRQGEIYWLNLPKPKGSEPGYRRPCVVVQNDTFNRSKIATTVVVILTSNLKLAQAPGNVLIKAQDTNLAKNSVANISQVLTVNKSDLKLDEKIGEIGTENLAKIIQGLMFLLTKV
jgi:mRNA interferase MazF